MAPKPGKPKKKGEPMTIAATLDAIDANVAYSTTQKRILKGRVRSGALVSALSAFQDSGITFSFGGSVYGIGFDRALASSFGHASPVFIHPDGSLVIYLTISKNGVQVFPNGTKTNPLIISNPPFTDSGGLENPLQAARDILRGLVG